MTIQRQDVDDHEPGWWVQVRGEAYGPYALAQVTAFLAEGRITARTPVARSPQGGWTTAAEAGLTASSDAATSVLALEQSPTADDPRLANLVVWADLPAGGEDHVDATLAELGVSARIGRDLWVLRTIQPVGVIRTAVAAGLSVGERFLVVDANRGRLAWSNLGLDAEASLRRVWAWRG